MIYRGSFIIFTCVRQLRVTGSEKVVKKRQIMLCAPGSKRLRMGALMDGWGTSITP